MKYNAEPKNTEKGCSKEMGTEMGNSEEVVFCLGKIMY